MEHSRARPLRSLALVAGAVLAASLAGGVAMTLAQGGGSDRPLRACVDAKTGAAQGALGAQGPSGAQGATGSPGERAFAGRQPSGRRRAVVAAVIAALVTALALATNAISFTSSAATTT